MGFLRAVLVTALLLAAPPSVRAGDPVRVGPDARTALALTVYSQESLAVVRDVRRATLPAGDGVLRFGGVPEQLDPRTVALRAADGTPLGVREQSFRYDLAGTDALLARWVGKPIELVETDEQLRTQTTSAELLAPGSPPIYRVGDRMLLGHPGRVQLPPLGEELFLEPTLSWRLAPTTAGTRELEATYATSGLGWEADYALSLASAQPRTAARLAAWITVRNDTRAGFERAQLALVAGRVHRAPAPGQPVAMRMRMAAAEADVAAAPPVEERALDYHRYALPDPVTLAPNETKQLHLLSADAVQVERRYRVTGPGLWAAGQPGEDEQSLAVEIRLSLRNEQKRGIGRPLPAGVVRVHAPTRSGAVEFVGEDRIGHVATGERVDLRVGEASDLVAKRRQLDYRQTGTKPYTAEVAAVMALRNHTDEAVVIDVREPLSGSWKVLESSHEAERVNARTLGFTVTVPGGGAVEVRYRVQLGP